MANLSQLFRSLPIVKVSSSGKVGEVFVEDAQGARADRSSCDSAECAQAGGTGGVRGALEQISGGGGVAARVGNVARKQLSRSKINMHENPRPTCGGQELVERGSECAPGRSVVTGSKVGMAGHRSQVSGAIVD